MDSYLDGQHRSILKIDILDIVLDLKGEINDSDRVMPIEVVAINLLVNTLKTRTCHILLAQAFNLLDSEVVAEYIKLVVNLIYQGNQLFRGWTVL